MATFHAKLSLMDLVTVSSASAVIIPTFARNIIHCKDTTIIMYHCVAFDMYHALIIHIMFTESDSL